MWFEGSDTHVAATLLSNECDYTIHASFFFDPKKCPKAFVVGDKVRLIGTRLQTWRDDLQLTGKNIQFGHSCISMSLTDAIEAWKHVRRVQPLLFHSKPIPGAQHHFPRLTMTAIVKKWGNPTKTQGAQWLIVSSMLFLSAHACCQVETFKLELSFHVYPMRITQYEDLSFLIRS